jgi:hypothetical protein
MDAQRKGNEKDVKHPLNGDNIELEWNGFNLNVLDLKLKN